MFIYSIEHGDKDFAAACGEELKRRRVEKGDRTAGAEGEGEPDGKK